MRKNAHAYVKAELDQYLSWLNMWRLSGKLLICCHHEEIVREGLTEVKGSWLIWPSMDRFKRK